MIKIALGFSGSLRSFVDCFPSFNENIVKQYDTDIFMYVPDEEKAEKKLSILDNISSRKIVTVFPETDLDEKSYNSRLCVSNKTQQVLRLMTYLERVNEMVRNVERKEKFRYDWVFRCRCDTRIIQGKLENLHVLDNSKIYIPNHDHWSGVNDRFAFSRSKLMNLYNSRIKKLSEFWNAGGVLHEETYLRSFLSRYKIPIASTSICVEILRESGETKFNTDGGNSIFPKLDFSDSWSFYRNFYSKNKRNSERIYIIDPDFLAHYRGN